MDLIRALMMKLEALPVRPGAIVILEAGADELQVEGYSVEQIAYHLALIVEAGLIETPGRGTMSGPAFRRLSWEGHDFVDSVRDDQVWARTRQGAAAAGGFTLDLLTDLAKGFIKKQIEEKTGISI